MEMRVTYIHKLVFFFYRGMCTEVASYQFSTAGRTSVSKLQQVLGWLATDQ